MNASSAHLPAANLPRYRYRSHASSRSPSQFYRPGGMSPRDAGRRSWPTRRLPWDRRGREGPGCAVASIRKEGVQRVVRPPSRCPPGALPAVPRDRDLSLGRPAVNWRWLAITSSAVRNGQFGISWQTSRYASPAPARRSTTSIVARETGVMSSARAGARRNGTSAPTARATAAILGSSVDTTTRANRPLLSAASTE